MFKTIIGSQMRMGHLYFHISIFKFFLVHTPFGDMLFMVMYSITLKYYIMLFYLLTWFFFSN